MKNIFTFLLLITITFSNAQINWNEASKGIIVNSLYSFASAPGNTLYASGTKSIMFDSGGMSGMTSIATLYETTDGGDNWTAVEMKMPKQYFELHALCVNNNKLFGHFYADKVSFEGEIMFSADGGINWTSAIGIFPEYEIHGIVAISSTEMIAAGGTSTPYAKAIYKSADGGQTWMPVSSQGITGDELVQYMGKVGTRLFASTHEFADKKRFYYSDDTGKTWKPATGIAKNVYVRGVASADGQTVYANALVIDSITKAQSMKMFVSSDGGVSWQNHTFNYIKPVYALGGLIYHNGSYYSSTTIPEGSFTDRVFKSDPLTPSVGVHETGEEKVAVYPNPATHELNIAGIDSAHAIQVINLQGQVLASAKDVGVIDISQLAQGVYFARITSGDNSYTVRFIKE